MRRGLLSRTLFIGLVVASMGFMMACGDSDDDDDSGDATPQATTQTFAAGSTMKQIVDRGRMVVGVKYDVPLFGLLHPVSRKVDGFDVAIAKEVAKELGLREDQIEF